MLTKNTAQKAIKNFKEKLIAHLGNQAKLYLFGSVARGDFHAESDIDVLVLIDGPVNTQLKEEIFGLAFDVELEMEVCFGVLVYAKERWDSPRIQVTPLHENIDKDGVLC